MQTQAVLASLSLQAAQLLLRLAEVDLQGGQVACQGVNLNLKADASKWLAGRYSGASPAFHLPA